MEWDVLSALRALATHKVMLASRRIAAFQTLSISGKGSPGYAVRQPFDASRDKFRITQEGMKAYEQLQRRGHYGA